MTDAPDTIHEVGTTRSGDVDIFYRRFGSAGKTPILLLHAANYFDSEDFIPAATLLAADREVAAHDARGFGQSGWSAGKDYSHDANLADVVAVLDALRWERAILVGVSRGGAYALLAASRFPERVAGLALVDYQPAIGIGHPGTPILTTQKIGLPRRSFPSVEEGLAATLRVQEAPPGSDARARVESFLERTPEGYVIATRDPDFINPVPVERGPWTTEIPIEVDLWAELERVSCPVLLIRASRPATPYTPDGVERLERDFSDIPQVVVDSGHDVAAEAADALAGAVAQFAHERVDSA